MENRQLEFILKDQSTLDEGAVKRMFELMEESYDHVSYPTFVNDLSYKKYVGILVDAHKVIQGFTTFGINPKGTGTKEYSIIFSGDTIIAPGYWGTQEMMRGWGISVGKIIAAEPHKKWYWFLLSKGHRTYMYLPLFFTDYYPSLASATNTLLKSIVDETASKLYPGFYDPASGVLAFDKKIGELKPELAQATFDKKNKPHVKFFLEKNPGFYKGDELMCLALLAPDNIIGYGKKYIMEGMLQKL